MKFFWISLLLVIPFFPSEARMPGLTDIKVTPSTLTREVKCADFSGDWKGSCTISGSGSVGVEWKIQQAECATLTIDGQMFLLDGMVTKVYSSRKVESGVSNTAFNWNPDHTVLTFSQANSGTIDIPTSFQGEMKISGNKMFYTFHSMVQKWDYKCEVTR